MFGYIRVEKSELLVREYEAYKAVYCGLCRQLGRDYSLFARFILSYDCTFYAIVAMSARSSCEGFENGRCRFNPLKKCSYCKCSDTAVSESAALSVILAYYKLIDAIEDGGFFKRLGCTLVKPLFSRWRKKAAKRFPKLEEISQKLSIEQKKAESDPDCGIDRAAHPTAEFLSSLLSFEAVNESERLVYSRLGYGIGRFIYLIDAADDLDDDIKNKNFNPFIPLGDEAAGRAEANLSGSLAMAYEAYSLLSLTDFKGIIENALLRGLPKVQEEVIKKYKETQEKQGR